MKKFNTKLTIALVSLFIGLILVAFGQVSKLFIMFGCFCVSVSFVLWALDRQDKVNKTLAATDEDVNSDSTITEEEMFEVEVAKQKLIKQNRKLQASLFIGAVLMIILGFCALI